MRPSRTPTSALKIPEWSRISAFVTTRSIAPSARRRPLPDGFAAPESRLLARQRQVPLDLDG
jgi:hypothetical protein